MEKKKPPVVLPTFRNKKADEAPDGIQGEEEEYIDVVSFPGTRIITDENLTRSFPTPIPESSVFSTEGKTRPVQFPDWVYTGLAKKDVAEDDDE
jgi:hypothetical protein